MRGRGGGGGYGFIQVVKYLYGCARKIILVHNLLHQSEARSWVPSLDLGPSGYCNMNSAYHVGVQPRDFNCDHSVDPTTYLWNGFLDFCCYDSTYIFEYEQRLLPKDDTHWEGKWRFFLLLVTVLTVLIFYLLLPISQEPFHFFMHVGVHVWVSQYDVYYGISTDFT